LNLSVTKNISVILASAIISMFVISYWLSNINLYERLVTANFLNTFFITFLITNSRNRNNSIIKERTEYEHWRQSSRNSWQRRERERD
jgi:hypothetical protein